MIYSLNDHLWNCISTVLGHTFDCSVDDMIMGDSSRQGILEIKSGWNILKTAEFDLIKFRSNVSLKRMLGSLRPYRHQSTLLWQSTSDSLRCKVTYNSTPETASLLSGSCSQLPRFPLGLIGCYHKSEDFAAVILATKARLRLLRYQK